MSMALIFAQFNGNTHAAPRFDALNGTVYPQGALRGQTSAKTRANPQDIFGFNKHSACADVACECPQASGAPLDFKGCAEAVARFPASLQAAYFRVSRDHGPDTLMMSIGAQKSSPSSVPLPRRYDGSRYDVQTPGRNVLFPPFASWTHDRTDSGYLLRGRRVCGRAVQSKQELWDRISDVPAMCVRETADG